MLRLPRIPWVLYAALFAAIAPASSGAGETLERAKREATELFRSVAKQRAVERGLCSLGSQWLDYPVPYDVAHQHLGLTIHADLAPGYDETKPREVIDPKGTMQEAFCDADEARKRTDGLAEDFKSGSLKAGNGLPASSFRITRTEYAFPVFDRNYKRAIVVVSSSEIGWYRRPDGAVRAYPWELEVTAWVYVKQDGVWRFRDSEFLAGS